jgi:hypothetical protein
MLVHTVQKRQFYGIPFTFISSRYNYYQPLDLLSVVSCVEILYCTIVYNSIVRSFVSMTSQPILVVFSTAR